ncbi:MAG: hypothetical protein JWR09_2609 [Mucilaginibacter sp.]|nr:hypothetical protein [Mucilaginibacter sp.]
MLVFLFHCHLAFFGSNNTIKSSTLWASFDLKKAFILFSPTALGWTGVPLFFIISGFLIHLGFLRNKVAFSASVFFSKRFWRIYPTYWLTLLLFIAIGIYIHAANAMPGFKDLFLHVLTIYNFNDNYIYTINPSYWSLAAEVQLYLLYPVFLLIRRKLGIKYCFFVVLAISIGTLLLGQIFHNFGTTVVYSKLPLQFWFIWAAGAYYAECYFSHGKPLIKKWNFAWVLLSYCVLTLFTCFSFTNYFAFYPATITWLLVFDWIISSDVINIESAPSKLLVLTGLSSYSFYLIHQPYLYQMLGWFGGWTTSPYRFMSIVPVFMFLLLVSYFMYRLVEFPSMRIGNFLRKRSKQNKKKG